MPQYLIDNRLDSFVSAISVPQLMQLAEIKNDCNQFKQVLAEMVKQSGQS